jgi:hypothetical protein
MWNFPSFSGDSSIPDSHLSRSSIPFTWANNVNRILFVGHKEMKLYVHKLILKPPGNFFPKRENEQFVPQRTNDGATLYNRPS